MAWTLLAAGFCFFINSQKTEVPLISLFIFLFAGMCLLPAELISSLKVEDSILLSWRRARTVYILCRGIPLDSQGNGNVSRFVP
jgi:hypothetical protein